MVGTKISGNPTPGNMRDRAMNHVAYRKRGQHRPNSYQVFVLDRAGQTAEVEHRSGGAVLIAGASAEW